MRLILTLIVTVIATCGVVTAASAQTSPPTRDPHTQGYVKAHELADGELPPADKGGDYILSSSHPVAPELANFVAGKDATPHGRVVEFTMTSAESKLYSGIERDSKTFGIPDPDNPAKLDVRSSHPAPWKRTVAVYVPNSYRKGDEAPLMVGADGPDREMFAALDALIDAHKLPPIVAVSIQNGGGDAQGSERGLEYDTMSGRYAEFVEREVLPRVEKQAGVRLTHNPNRRATTGGSSGGSAALIMAWYHPEWYRRVLTWSGTFINQQWPWNAQTPQGAWGFHTTLIPNAKRKPLRLWMEVGDRDFLNPNNMRDGMHDWVEANERMARVLAAKGYPYQFVFAKNAGHVDRAVRGQLWPEALLWLWRGVKK